MLTKKWNDCWCPIMNIFSTPKNANVEDKKKTNVDLCFMNILLISFYVLETSGGPDKT